MNPLFRTLLILAVASAAIAGEVTVLKAQPAEADASSTNILPPNIAPDSPVAQVIKLTQAGTDINVIKAFVANSGSAFNLDADTIVSLKDAGVPTDIINAMMNHDKNLNATAGTSPSAPEPAPAPQPVPTPQTPAPTVYAPAPDNTAPGVTDNPPTDLAPPPVQVTQQYFVNTLSPYGSWVQVDGYGTCWRPTVVLYDGGWNPYCDRGRWAYTDCGWYWNSDYAWGATFHYGRWFRHSRLGWCWYPDTVWAPSWVTWRSSDDCCGWAPLPPFTVFTPGIGFAYRGISVGFNCNFGLGANCFIFVSPSHLCDHHPRSFCFDHNHVTQVFDHTTVINHFDSRGHTLVNNGISVNTISAQSHHTIEPVKVGSLPNVRREGWQGTVTTHTVAYRDHSSQPNNQVYSRSQFHSSSPTVNHVQNNTTVTVSPTINHVPNQNNNQFNNYNNYNNYSTHHSQSSSAPSGTVARYNNYNYQNNTQVQPPMAQTPATPAPAQHHVTPQIPPAPMQQRSQQNDYHSYNGTYNQHSYNNGNAPAVSQGQGQGQAQGQAHGYGQSSGQGSSQGQVRGAGHN